MIYILCNFSAAQGLFIAYHILYCSLLSAVIWAELLSRPISLKVNFNKCLWSIEDLQNVNLGFHFGFVWLFISTVCYCFWYFSDISFFHSICLYLFIRFNLFFLLKPQLFTFVQTPPVEYVYFFGLTHSFCATGSLVNRTAWLKASMFLRSEAS